MTTATLIIGWDAAAEVTLLEAERLVTASARAENSSDTDKDTDIVAVLDFGSVDRRLSTHESVSGAGARGIAEQHTVVLGIDEARVDAGGTGSSFASFIVYGPAQARGKGVSRTVIVFDVESPVPYRYEVHLVAYEQEDDGAATSFVASSLLEGASTGEIHNHQVLDTRRDGETVFQNFATMGILAADRYTLTLVSDSRTDGDDNGDEGAGSSSFRFEFLAPAPYVASEVDVPGQSAGGEAGYALSLDGSRLVVGVPAFSSDPPVAGTAYVFERDENSWQQTAQLTPSDSSPGDGFGVDVAISGTRIVVGTLPPDDTDPAAYIFELGALPESWDQVARLSAADTAAGDRFGGSVAITGDTVAVGASRADNLGTAYVFDRDRGGVGSWGQAARLTASDPSQGAHFGSSVSLSSNTLAVGADSAGGSGSAYLFARNLGGPDAWGQLKRVEAADKAEGDDFGGQLSLAANTLVVGAGEADQGGEDSGAAYVFERDNGGTNAWGQTAKLVASDATPYDDFGFSVDMYRDTIVVGADGENSVGQLTGQAYVFARNDAKGGWTEIAKLNAVSGVGGDQFGFDVALGEGTVFVGAPGADAAGLDSGAVLSFVPEPKTLLLQMVAVGALGVLRSRGRRGNSWTA